MRHSLQGLQPQLVEHGCRSHKLAVRAIRSTLASALRIAPKTVFSNRAVPNKCAPAEHCRAIMGQRNIASFFTKPAAKPPLATTPINASESSKRSTTAKVASSASDAGPRATADIVKPIVLKDTQNVPTEVRPLPIPPSQNVHPTQLESSPAMISHP